MFVACPICDVLHEITDTNLPEGLREEACEECGATLVLVAADAPPAKKRSARTSRKPAPARHRRTPATDSTRAWGIAAVAILCIINYSLVGSAVFGLHYSVKNSEAYQTSESFLRENDLLKQVIGDNIEFGFLPSGKMRSNGNQPTAEFTITVTGSYRSTVAWVALVKQQQSWQVVKASYRDPSGTFQPLLAQESAFKVETLPPPPAESRITEQDILIVLAAYEKAVNERNVEGILAHMSYDMSFNASVHLPSEIKTFHFTRSEYQAHLQRNYNAAATYHFARTGTSISITQDGTRAKAHFQMLERSTFKSGNWRFKGTEVMHFELRGGRPVITRVELTGETQKV